MLRARRTKRGLSPKRTRAAARAGDPVDEILRGAERGGEGHKLDGLGEVDDGLLPDRTPLRIVDVVHLAQLEIYSDGETATRLGQSWATATSSETSSA